MHILKRNNIGLNRKMLAQLSILHPKGFAALTTTLTK
jgi:ribosomal protein L20